MPDPTVGELLQQGIIITVLGITLVFAGLGLLWGLMELLMRVMPPEAEKAKQEVEAAAAAGAEPLLAEAAPAGAPDFTAERAQVAAIAAAMLLARALPGQAGVPVAVPASVDGTNGHNGHDDPWMSTNRVRSLQSWQPPRVLKR